MNFKKRGVLLVAALAASAAAIPTPSASAWIKCYDVFVDGPSVCVGSPTCQAVGEKVEKVTGLRPGECLQ